MKYKIQYQHRPTGWETTYNEARRQVRLEMIFTKETCGSMVELEFEGATHVYFNEREAGRDDVGDQAFAIISKN